jgi:hypothetical protein
LNDSTFQSNDTQKGTTCQDQLANYTRLSNCWQKLARESDRIKVAEYRKTLEGRPMLMAIIASPEKHKKLDRFKDISKRLALAEGLSDEQARALRQGGQGVGPRLFLK